MAKWPLDDGLALKIGRVILAFGNLDQQIYHAIKMLSASAGSIPVLDDRFKHRMRELRSLMQTLTGNDPAFMSEYDRFQDQVRNVEQRRADLAHGIPFHVSGGIQAYTNRNPQKWRPFTSEELADLPDTILDLRQRLSQLRLKAQKLAAHP
jgi:hypothetical protein